MDFVYEYVYKYIYVWILGTLNVKYNAGHFLKQLYSGNLKLFCCNSEFHFGA